MSEPNDQPATENQTKEIIASLRNEIASLKSQLAKKADRIASLDTILKQVMESHGVQRRAYEDLEDKLKDVIDLLRKRVLHGDILDFLKVKDSNEYQFRKLW